MCKIIYYGQALYATLYEMAKYTDLKNDDLLYN